VDHFEYWWAKSMVRVALGLEQLKLRRDQVDFFRNVVVASRTKGKRNREIPIDVLDARVNLKKMSTNWPQMNGMNPSVETISNYQLNSKDLFPSLRNLCDSD
jgi:hypothetical protein